MAAFVWVGSDPMFYFYTDYAWYYDYDEKDEWYYDDEFQE